jgi:hypothetical protein
VAKQQRQAEFPGGHLACGQLHALLRPDEWTALQWMRFRFSKADSACDLLLREQPVSPGRADELAGFVAAVHSHSGEPLFPLRFGRGAHLQRDVQALVSRSPRRRGGPAYLRDIVPLDTALTVLGGLSRRAPEENQPVVATSAMTLLRLTWEGRRSEIEREDHDASDAELVEWLETSRAGVGEPVWRQAIAACVRLEEAAVALAIALRRGPAGGGRPEATLARRVPGFFDEVYRQALALGLDEAARG